MTWINEHDIEVCSIDPSVPDQVWFRLRSIPSVQFCGAYVAPSDSSYYNHTNFAEIQTRTMYCAYQYVVLGDLNARCGNNLNTLVKNNIEPQYVPVDFRENENGRDLVQICKDNNLLVLNNLHGNQQGNNGFLK